MARRKKRSKSKFFTIIIILVLIVFGVLIANSMMNGKLLENLKIAAENKAKEVKEKQVQEEDNKEIDEELDEEIEETKKEVEEVFTKKEDDTSFKLVDKTVDDVKPTVKLTEKDRENLAIKVVKEEWYEGEEPSETNVYFSVVDKKSDNVYTVEVRDKKTTRIKSTYDVNVVKKEIVNTF